MDGRVCESWPQFCAVTDRDLLWCLQGPGAPAASFLCLCMCCTPAPPARLSSGATSSKKPSGPLFVVPLPFPYSALPSLLSFCPLAALSASEGRDGAAPVPARHLGAWKRRLGGCLWRGGRGLPGVAGGSEAPCCSLASLMPRRPGSWWGGASVFLLHLVCPQRRPATFPPLPREGWESGGAVGCRAQTEPQGV